MTNHAKLKGVFKNHRGKRFRTEEIKDMIMKMVPDFADGSVRPNDHAEGNKSPCRCAGTHERIFDRIKRGWYKVR